MGIFAYLARRATVRREAAHLRRYGCVTRKDYPMGLLADIRQAAQAA